MAERTLRADLLCLVEMEQFFKRLVDANGEWNNYDFDKKDKSPVDEVYDRLLWKRVHRNRNIE